MKGKKPQQQALFFGAAVGAIGLVAGVLLSVAKQPEPWQTVLGIVLTSLGSAVLFPILVSYAYDKLREKWLGDELWRLFAELSDAGIARIYKDREQTERRDNGVTRLSSEFRDTHNGEVRMMGPSLRVFFNELGPFYRDIKGMLSAGSGVDAPKVRVLLAREDSPAITDRIKAEEGLHPVGSPPQATLDLQASMRTLRILNSTWRERMAVRQFLPAPYATLVIFPDIAFFSPNILSRTVPARLPLILFRQGSHAYEVLCEYFEYLWEDSDTIDPFAPRPQTPASN